MSEKVTSQKELSKFKSVPYNKPLKNKSGKVTWWWSGSAYIVVDDTVSMQNFYFSSCRMYELI